MNKVRGKQLARTVRKAVILLAGMAIFAGCASQGETANEGAAEASATEVHTVKVQDIQQLAIFEPLEQVADVIASAQVSVPSKIGGDVAEIVKERGATVAKGETIVILDNADALLQHEQANLAYESAALAYETGKKQWEINAAKLEQALGEAARALNQTKNNYELGLVGQSELDQAENAYNNVKNELALLKESSYTSLSLQLESSELALRMSERSLQHHEIKAPIDGVLTDLTVQEGMTLAPGFGIGQIQKLDPIKIKALLTLAAAEKVRGKKELQFYMPGSGEMHVGQVAYLADVIDTQSNAYELTLSVDNPNLTLKPGMKVQIRLTDEEEQLAAAIPSISIVREGSDNFVYVLEGDKAVKRKVELGRINGLNQEVLSGVKEGEVLIVSGQHQLQDGESVKVEK